ERLGGLRGKAAALVRGRNTVSDLDRTVRIGRAFVSGTADDRLTLPMNHREAVQPRVRLTGGAEPAEPVGETSPETYISRRPSAARRPLHFSNSCGRSISASRCSGENGASRRLAVWIIMPLA